MIGRFLAFIIKGIAIVVGGLGILAIVGNFLAPGEGYLVPGIVMLVAAVVVGIPASKKGERSKIDKMRNSLKACKKCGGAYSSQCKYTYELGKATKAPISGLLLVPGTIELRCTKCGEKKILGETFEIAGVDPEDEIREAVEHKVNAYLG